MKKLTLFIAVIAIIYGHVGDSHALPHLQYRLDETSTERMLKLMPIVEAEAYRHQLPTWLMVGIIYNESNARAKVRGDNGRAWGLGQIHCGSGGFSWLTFLRDRKIIKRCSDLLKPEKAVASIAHILVYLRNKERSRRKLRWINVATSYHKGEAWRVRNLGQAAQYFKAVRYFGKLFKGIHDEDDCTNCCCRRWHRNKTKEG